MVVVPAVLVNRPDTVPLALLLKVAALFTTPVMVGLLLTVPVPEIATVPEIRLLLVTVPPLTVAPPLSWPALVVVPAVLVNRPDTVPFALLLKVAALFTTPVMVALFSTSPVPEIATVPEIRLLLVTVPPLTVAPPLSCPSLVVVPAVLVSRPDTVPLALLLKVAALFTAPVMVRLLVDRATADGDPAIELTVVGRGAGGVGQQTRHRAACVVVEGRGIVHRAGDGRIVLDVAGAGNRYRSRDQIVVGDGAAADGGAAIELAVVDGRTVAVLVSSPDTVPFALLLKVAALFTAPVMVRLLLTVPPVTVAPPLSWPLLVVVPAVLVSSPDTVPFALLLKVAALFTAPVMVALFSTVAGAGNRDRPRNQVVVGDGAAADRGAAIELAGIGRGARGVGSRPDTVPLALLLKVAALFTAPVMVGLLLTVPVPEIATVPDDQVDVGDGAAADGGAAVELAAVGRGAGGVGQQPRHRAVGVVVEGRGIVHRPGDGRIVLDVAGAGNRHRSRDQIVVGDGAAADGGAAIELAAVGRGAGGVGQQARDRAVRRVVEGPGVRHRAGPGAVIVQRAAIVVGVADPRRIWFGC